MRKDTDFFGTKSKLVHCPFINKYQREVKDTVNLLKKRVSQSIIHK